MLGGKFDDDPLLFTKSELLLKDVARYLYCIFISSKPSMLLELASSSEFSSYLTSKLGVLFRLNDRLDVPSSSLSELLLSSSDESESIRRPIPK